MSWVFVLFRSNSKNFTQHTSQELHVRTFNAFDVVVSLVGVVSNYPTTMILAKGTLKMTDVLVDGMLKGAVEASLQWIACSTRPSTTADKVFGNLCPEHFAILVSATCGIRWHYNKSMRQNPSSTIVMFPAFTRLAGAIPFATSMVVTGIETIVRIRQEWMMCCDCQQRQLLMYELWKIRWRRSSWQIMAQPKFAARASNWILDQMC